MCLSIAALRLPSPVNQAVPVAIHSRSAPPNLRVQGSIRACETAIQDGRLCSKRLRTVPPPSPRAFRGLQSRPPCRSNPFSPVPSQAASVGDFRSPRLFSILPSSERVQPRSTRESSHHRSRRSSPARRAAASACRYPTNIFRARHLERPRSHPTAALTAGIPTSSPPTVPLADLSRHSRTVTAASQIWRPWMGWAPCSGQARSLAAEQAGDNLLSH